MNEYNNIIKILNKLKFSSLNTIDNYERFTLILSNIIYLINIDKENSIYYMTKSNGTHFTIDNGLDFQKFLKKEFKHELRKNKIDML